MIDRPSVITKSRLIELLESAGAPAASHRAIDLVRSLDASEFQIGRSSAQGFIALMRRKLRSASDAGLEFDGWPQLEAALSSLEPETPIAGIALPDGGSIVMRIDADKVFGCLIHSRATAGENRELQLDERPNAEDE